MSECSHDFDSNELSNYCAKGCGETWALYTIKNLQKQNAVLREALEFYADRCKGHEGMAPQYNELNDLNCINENFGEIARQALSKLRALGIVKEGEK